MPCSWALTYIATGHYTRREAIGDQVLMKKGLDSNKDQSYFLHQVGHEQLLHTLFPVGELEKSEVRRLAEQHGLITHNKKDSTGICFIGERRFRDFLKQYLPAQPGPIKTIDGDTIGEHSGLMYHTIGQRQGLGIGGLKGASESPWYVVEKDLENNVLLVAQGNNHPMLFSDALTASDIFWISGKAPELPAQLTAKVRYRQQDQACRLELREDGRYVVIFDESQRAVTPGQSVVFYDGQVCLGGGVIESRHASAEEALAA